MTESEAPIETGAGAQPRALLPDLLDAIVRALQGTGWRFDYNATAYLADKGRGNFPVIVNLFPFPERCGAAMTVTRRVEDSRSGIPTTGRITYACERPKGHLDSHQDGSFHWYFDSSAGKAK